MQTRATINGSLAERAGWTRAFGPRPAGAVAKPPASSAAAALSNLKVRLPHLHSNAVSSLKSESDQLQKYFGGEGGIDSGLRPSPCGRRRKASGVRRRCGAVEPKGSNPTSPISIQIQFSH